MSLDGDRLLGTNVTAVQLSSFKSFPESKKDLTAAHTSVPTTFHIFWKNPAVKPSGPGALSGFILKITVFISSLVTLRTRNAAFSNDNILSTKLLKSLTVENEDGAANSFL